MRPTISISTDFGPGNKGIGVMEATILEICPEAQIIRLANDIPGFDIRSGARLLEALDYLPVGCHICVVDPGVGTERRGIIIETMRGDFLIGPDNGVLIPATRFLSGIARVHQITNEKFMRQPVSHVFHGRDVFAPAAAHLAAGISISEFGPSLEVEKLHLAPYDEATFKNSQIAAEVISVNSFGNIFINVRQDEMHKIVSLNDALELQFKNRSIVIPYKRTFGEVSEGESVILDDDFGRVEIAINQGNFAVKYDVHLGENVILRKP